MKAVVLIAAAAVLISSTPSQPLTVVAVAVEQSDGRPVEGLSAADFSVQVDDRPLAVERATLDRTSPSVALLLDLTSSAAWPGGGSTGPLFKTIRDHVLDLLPEGTPLLIGSFGRSVQWQGDVSLERAEQLRQLRSAVSLPEDRRSGPSPVWDTVAEAVAILQPRSGRRAVLLVTDGQTTGNRLGLADVADRAIAAGVSINIVFTGPSGVIRQTREVAAGVYPDRPLTQLATATGGYYGASSPSSSIEKAPVDALRKTAQAIRSAYRLEFLAPVKAEFQRLSVSTRNSDHRVRAPIGFKNGGAASREKP
jgi:hypothetical protein